MRVVVGCADRYLMQNLGAILEGVGIRPIRSSDIERIIRELKIPGRAAILDMGWEAIQSLSVLRKIVNIARITGNQVLVICPDQEEDLKKLAKAARVDELFIRYELETSFRSYVATELIVPKT